MASRYTIYLDTATGARRAAWWHFSCKNGACAPAAWRGPWGAPGAADGRGARGAGSTRATQRVYAPGPRG